MAVDCLVGISGEVCITVKDSKKEKCSGYVRKHGKGAISKRKPLFPPRSA